MQNLNGLIMNTKITYLKQLIYAGAIEKDLVMSDHVLDRINYELNIIENRGFTDNYVVYTRIIEICNELNLFRSYGRGSALNSAVNYCLDITKLNPISANLISERFFHPTLNYLPDIDIDIPAGYQQKIMDRLVQKHPAYHAYFIAYSPEEKENILDIIFKDVRYKKHPCGILIRESEILDSVFKYDGGQYYFTKDVLNDPICKNKFDLLELPYLNRLQLIVNMIGEEFHPYNLPLTDEKVFMLFASGELDNIFQFDTPAMKRILAEFQPESMSDLAIINALFRPGLIEYIPDMIHAKFNYDNTFCKGDWRVADILKETYGILIYQETLLHLAHEIAGLLYEEAELMRINAIRDKSNMELKKFGDVFAKGCRNNSSLSANEIESLTQVVSSMIRATFQKAHSFSYSVLAYWGGYYKTYFRKHFDLAFDDIIEF